MEQPLDKHIKPVEITNELRESYLDYAMSVIVSRALPDVRDGLKPVQRRILWAMWDSGLIHGAKFKKSANVVGEVMGKYHPHGDSAIYDTIARMAQDFSLRYPLIDGQGNWGCFTGETKIKLTDGRGLSFKELVKEYEQGKKNYTYTFNHETQSIEIAEIERPRITRKKAELVKVTLDNGESVRCTPDHKFMLRDGSYKEAQSLRFEDSLMPGYTRFSIKKDDPKTSRVRSVRKEIEREDVYEITIGKTHNFLLDVGVFVHNSVDGDAPAAMRYCVTGDTLIVTHKGLQPINTLPSNGSENIDIKVLSRDRSIHKADKWFDSGKHKTIKIRTRHGFELQGTLNHPILTWTRDYITGKPYFEWKLLQDAQKNDIAVIERTNDLLWPEKNIDLVPYWPEENKRWEDKILPKKLDENLSFILGALIAEGTIKEHEIEFCNSDLQFIDMFSDRWKKVFPDCRLHRFSRNPSSYGKKPYYTLEIHSRKVITLLLAIGLHPVKSRDKRIPHLIFQSPKSVVSAFLQGYFEGDGSASNSGRMNELSAISKSELLLKEMQVLLLRFGIASTRRFDSWRKTHKLYIRGLKNYFLFQHQIHFAGTTKRLKFEKIVNNLVKDFPQSDFVPFLSEFVRNHTARGKKEVTYKVNFDRYSNLEKRASSLFTAVEERAQSKISDLFATLLSNNYLFDPIVDIKHGGVNQVYSIRVASECHSFIGNGFVNHNTEARLTKTAETLLTDIEKETVEWQGNYDNTRFEPKCLPAKIPNLLLNGAVGIAVGMATSIPPHNMSELVDGIVYLSEHPDADTKDLMTLIPGPDFPTGGIIYDKKALEEAYATGKGSVTMRAVADIEERKSGSYQIVITEIPYQVNKSELISKMANLVVEKKVEGIKDIRDESDREGMRIVIEVKNDGSPQKILNQLYQYTELQKNFYFNMIALAGGIQPQVLSLKEILSAYLDHRVVVVKKRTAFDLKKAEERAHILEGLEKALNAIDKVIATIKKSKDKEDAKKNLMKQFALTDIQTNAILEMRLQTLAALERHKIEDELKEKKKLIAELQGILKSEKKIAEIVRKEALEMKTAFPDPRKTKIVASGLKDFREEDLIPEEDVIITLTKDGYIKRLPATTFKAQKRGGKGLIGIDLKEEDQIYKIVFADTHDNVLFFTDRGRAFQTRVYDVPVASRTAKGKSIYTFLSMPGTEKVNAIVTYGNNEKSGFLVMATERGVIKKTSLNGFDNVRKNGIIALKLKSDDSLRWVRRSSGNDEIILVTQRGQSIRFKEKDARPMGRTASGIRAIKLKKGDMIAGFDVIEKEREAVGKERLVVVMANGYGKQTLLKEYKTQRRGGGGIKTANVTPKTGHVIDAQIVDDEYEEVIAFSSKGQVIRTKLSAVRIAGRATQGVRIMNLEKGDSLSGIVCL